MWIEWEYTEEKPYPETLDTVLNEVRFGDGSERESEMTVAWWHRMGGVSNFNPSHATSDCLIVAYKVA